MAWSMVARKGLGGRVTGVMCHALSKGDITGVRIIGPIGIGEVQMTTIFYRKKSEKSEKKWFSFGDWMGI